MTITFYGNMQDWKALLQPAFIICVAVLLVAAGGLAITGRATVRKEPLELRKPLGDLDEKALAPYRVMRRGTISNADELKALGTQEYIQWTLEDTSAEPGSPVRFVSLFVTYYTGRNMDAVVHTPEACYLGGGSQPLDAYNHDFVISGWSSNGEADKQTDVPVRCAVFTRGGSEAWETSSPFTVMYTFKVNGTYQKDRTATRKKLSLNLSRYAYYAKVEWQFFGSSGIGASMVYPSKEDNLKASEKLLKAVLGELERSHWPDWDQAVRQQDGEHADPDGNKDQLE